MMAKSLDQNEAAFLRVLMQEDPEAEVWIASWAIGDKAKAHGADSLATGSIEAMFSVMKRLYERKLVDKQDGRSTKLENGYSINQAGREALSAYSERPTG